MKTSILKLLFISVVLINVSCDKNHPTPVCGGNNNPDPCKNTIEGTGTIENCGMNSELWYIDATGVQTMLYPMKLIYLMPVDLPEKWKKKNLSVSFKYTSLTDSVKIQCGWCGTPPAPNALKIDLCDIKENVESN